METSRTYPADDQVAEALRWIGEVFAPTGAQYQVVGGLAARVYGGTRPLVDLDFHVSAREESVGSTRRQVGSQRHRGRSVNEAHEFF